MTNKKVIKKIKKTRFLVFYEIMKRESVVIGLTGNIACGKSFVASILERECGITKIDADLLGSFLPSFFST